MKQLAKDIFNVACVLTTGAVAVIAGLLILTFGWAFRRVRRNVARKFGT